MSGGKGVMDGSVRFFGVGMKKRFGENGMGSVVLYYRCLVGRLDAANFIFEWLELVRIYMFTS